MQRSLFIALVCAACAALIAGCDGVLDDAGPQSAPASGQFRQPSGSFIEKEPEPEPVTTIPPEILDYFNRSFATEHLTYSVAVLDSAGNLILRVGRYGNVEDGKPLAARGGPPTTR